MIYHFTEALKGVKRVKQNQTHILFFFKYIEKNH